MANICDFSMVVKGKKENIEKFINMMEQKGNVWMGRGAMVNRIDIEEVENEKYRYLIDGDTKWSVKSSMILNAVSMRENPDMWFFGEDVDKTKLSFVTLFEACEQLELAMEVYSEELGDEFQEHYLFDEGQVMISEIVEYTEEYNEETEEYESSGGFEDWNFEI